MSSPLPTGWVRGTPGYRNLTLAMLFAGFASFSLLYSMQPLLPLFAAEFGVSAEESSLAVSLATAPLAIVILIAGPVSDKIGRRPLMLGAMFGAAALTLATGFVGSWHGVLALRFLTGVVLGGVPAVAMAYVAEEIDARSVGPAMGLYIAGNAFGGMVGRLGVSLVTDLLDWRWAMIVSGIVSLALAEAFRRLAPRSRRFVAQPVNPRALRDTTSGLFRDAAMPLLFAEAFLLMGAFVTLYNYAGFRLLAPPFSLSHAAVGAVFLLYILGSTSSAQFGGLAERHGRRWIFWVPITLLLGGIALTLPESLGLVIVGIAVATIGFFGAHSIASSWVGRRALAARGQASAFYLFFYYMGSSVLGSLGGFAWSHAGWGGVVGYAGALVLVALLIAARLWRVPPLPVPEVTPPPIAAD